MFDGVHTQGNENSHFEINNFKHFSIIEVDNVVQTENYKEVLHKIEESTSVQKDATANTTANKFSFHPNNLNINEKENIPSENTQPNPNEGAHTQTNIFKIRSPVVYKPKTPLQTKFKIKAVVRSEIKGCNGSNSKCLINKQESRHIRCKSPPCGIENCTGVHKSTSKEIKLPNSSLKKIQNRIQVNTVTIPYGN